MQQHKVMPRIAEGEFVTARHQIKGLPHVHHVGCLRDIFNCKRKILKISVLCLIYHVKWLWGGYN